MWTKSSCLLKLNLQGMLKADNNFVTKLVDSITKLDVRKTKYNIRHNFQIMEEASSAYFQLNACIQPNCEI